MNQSTSLFLQLCDKYYLSNPIKDSIDIADPALDSTFKYLFIKNPEILRNMLNSILFPEESKIYKLIIIDKEISFPDQKFNKGTIRSDIACKAYIDNNEIIVGIEIQIGYNSNFTQRLFKYQTGLSYINNYKQTLILGLFINAKKIPEFSSDTKPIKSQNGKSTIIDLFDIIEIDLQEEINKIISGKDIIINNKKLGVFGKEWIKLLGIRKWGNIMCGKYSLPKVTNLSSNPCFNKAIEVLSLIPREIFNRDYINEDDYMDMVIENEKEKMRIVYGLTIKHTFEMFQHSEEQYLLNLLKNYTFKVSQVDSVVLDEIGEGKTSKYYAFLLFLKNNDILID